MLSARDDEGERWGTLEDAFSFTFDIDDEEEDEDDHEDFVHAADNMCMCDGDSVMRPQIPQWQYGAFDNRTVTWSNSHISALQTHHVAITMYESLDEKRVSPLKDASQSEEAIQVDAPEGRRFMVTMALAFK